jgi:hypothetical protein
MEPAQVAVLDQVVGMLVVSREADVTANVMHQRRIFQPFALAVRESVNRARLIEEGERKPYHVIGVIGVITAALCEFQRAPTPHVRDAVDLRDLAAVAANVIEHQPFTQREVAERQFLGAEAAKNRVEQNRARDNQVRAPRVESGDAQPLLEIQLGDVFANPPDLLDGDVQIAQLCWSGPACGGRSDRSDAQDRPGCANDAVKTGRQDLFAVAVDFAKDMLDDLPLVALGERITAHEAFGQPYRSNLEAARKLQGARRAERNLDAAAADVDDDGASPAHVNAIHCGLMNETRLFGPRNDARTDAGFVFKAGQEFAAVASFTRCAGRGSENLIHLVRVRDPLELR